MKARIIFLLLSAAVLAGAFALTDALNSRTDEPGVDRGDGVTVAVGDGPALPRARTHRRRGVLHPACLGRGRQGHAVYR